MFLYRCELQRPDTLFLEAFEFRGRWYAVPTVTVDNDRRHMTRRSPKWQTVHVPARDFEQVADPLVELLQLRGAGLHRITCCV